MRRNRRRLLHKRLSQRLLSNRLNPNHQKLKDSNRLNNLPKLPSRRQVSSRHKSPRRAHLPGKNLTSPVVVLSSIRKRKRLCSTRR